MTDERRNPPEYSVYLVMAGHGNSSDGGRRVPRRAIDPRPELGSQSIVMCDPWREETGPPRAGLRELFEPSGAEPGQMTRAGWDQPSIQSERPRLGPDRDPRAALAGRDRDPETIPGDGRADLGEREDRLFRDYRQRIERIAADAQSALAAARAELRASLAEQDERLPLADCGHLAAIADINFRLGQLADQQGRMAAANRQLAGELRGELHRALEANRAAWEAALARQDERSSLADRQGLGRHRQLIEAMARMVQPIADLQGDLDRPSAAVDDRPAPSLPEQGASLPINEPPAPPAPEPGSILAFCDMPGPDPVSTGPGHLRVRGWALSMAGVEDVGVFVDGLPREGVVYGALRLDVEAALPEFPDAHHSGFVGKIDLEGLAEGEHSLVVRVRGRDGGQLELTRSFRLDPLARPDRSDLNVEYPDWLAERMPSESDLARMRIEGMNLPYQPVISLVVPVYNTPEEYLSPMVDSVLAQTYGKWELCLANGGSTAPHVRPFLNRLAEQDARVKVVHLAQNLGIAGHSNAALALATGEFIGLLDSDDVLMPHALFEVARALNDAPETDLIYSDEDHVDDTGRDRWSPFFKPDWSPDLLLSVNYVCHFGVYRRSLVEAIGGFRSSYDGSQDYDLVLRFTEQTDRIVHLPSILYSWRAIPGSTARDIMAKPYAVDAARRAIADALQRRGVAGHVEPGFVPGRWRVRYELRGQPAVTLVIAAGGNMKCLQACLESVLVRSTYSNLQVLVTDDSDGTAVADLCRTLARRDPRLRYRRFRLKPFNYSAINNSAVSVVDTPYVVLLNDDITVIAPDWVEAMLEHAQRPEVGVVGAKLLYPDRSLQHAGVILGPYQNCGHAFKHLPEDDGGYFGLARSIRNCSAVTFACAMMRRSVFDEVGGLDEENLAVAFNDVDMCLRIRERGYRVVYTPHAVLFHHESATRTMHSNPGEEEYMRRRWAGVICHDPFYNPNLTREAEDYSLNFDAPTIAERLGLIEDGLVKVRYEPELEVSPILGPKGRVAQDQAGDRPPAASSETPIELVTRTVDFGPHMQGMEGRWRERFNDLSARLEQQMSRPTPERDTPIVNGGRPGPLPTAAPPAVDAPERANGYRPKRNSYPEVRRRIREVVNAELPTGSVVVVVSRGDDNLLQLGPRRGWHFPQTQAGVYAGYHPADSGEAIAHLEEIRRKGADYLLFPSTAFWWLGFYGDFQKYLESHYPCICSDPSCLIFQLSTTPGGAS
jgi:GT2 family glycosyltransferase